mmetsp:Transcript_10933/g.34799  ORF Transcript_10933/g.34799 Transcript_10933/m.34799 type:complete len:488 (+) Transcript_10933:3921-5384(+)
MHPAHERAPKPAVPPARQRAPPEAGAHPQLPPRTKRLAERPLPPPQHRLWHAIGQRHRRRPRAERLARPRALERDRRIGHDGVPSAPLSRPRRPEAPAPPRRAVAEGRNAAEEGCLASRASQGRGRPRPEGHALLRAAEHANSNAHLGPAGGGVRATCAVERQAAPCDPKATRTVLGALPTCPACGAPALPQALLFDEEYESHSFYQYRKARRWLECAKALVFVGTSFAVGVTEHALLGAAERSLPSFSFNIVPESATQAHEAGGELGGARQHAPPMHHIVGCCEVTLPKLAALVASPLAAKAADWYEGWIPPHAEAAALEGLGSDWSELLTGGVAAGGARGRRARGKKRGRERASARNETTWVACDACGKWRRVRASEVPDWIWRSRARSRSLIWRKTSSSVVHVTPRSATPSDERDASTAAKAARSGGSAAPGSRNEAESAESEDSSAPATSFLSTSSSLAGSRRTAPPPPSGAALVTLRVWPTP